MLNKIPFWVLTGASLWLAACSGPADVESVEEATAPVESEPSPEPSSEVASRPEVNPEIWPAGQSSVERDPEIEAFVADLLSRMTLEEKVGQVLQADLSTVTPELAAEYNLGSILNGGNSAPGNNNYAPAEDWLALADDYYQASTNTSDGGVGIPILWGTDAVHGHSNVVGATLFPHNIGLGVANNPDLMRRIGEITALEIRATGPDWTFAPTLAVVQNDTWGRTYESFSENPEIVANLSAPLVEGIQGVAGSDEFLGDRHTIATAKHFVGDGGTYEGVDQGDTRVTEEELRDIHAAGYPPAINAGVQTVMASFNSWNGVKMHGFEDMLTDVLVDQMGFDGFVVGDWEGHGQIAGCTNENCAQALLAGVDMYMASGSWQTLYGNLLTQVQDGTIPMERLDEAVTRILRVKARAGLFDSVAPSERPNAGDFSLLGHPDHRAVARDAVRQSLVLLKNEGGVLPIAASANILVTGDGADNIAKQSGGWTINWQGDGHDNDDFPGATSIYGGFVEAMEGAGGTVTLSDDGSYDAAPDVAVVVFGEEPYAEFVGDRDFVDFDDESGLELLRQYQADGIPTVAVFLTGRPLWMNRELNASDAFVVAWLPGSEGGGVADVVVGDSDGEPRFDFTGELSFSWPSLATQNVLNERDPNYDPLLAYGFSTSYAEPGDSLGELSEDSGIVISEASERASLVASGRATDFYDFTILSGIAEVPVSGPDARINGQISVTLDDRDIQDDARRVNWEGPASLILSGDPQDLSELENQALAISFQVTSRGEGPVSMWMGCGDNCEGRLDITGSILIAEGKGWRDAIVPLSCFAEAGADLSQVEIPFAVTGAPGLEMWLDDVTIVQSPSADASCDL